MGSVVRPEYDQMSLAEYASRPFPAFAKLAGMLRNIPAMQFVFAKVSALLRGDKASGEPIINKFLGEAPGVTRSTEDQGSGLLGLSGNLAIAGPKPSDQSGRETLIRRRWTETGIKMWNPDVHGAGHAALNIQGTVELLRAKPDGTMPAYDKLEFKLIGDCIVCEGVVVDPPKSRRPFG